ncbi:putative uncharacterized protein [Blautia sp. CAG:52]|nr:putative uncharacterized protein [Blautia sp. CAG:52]
MIHDKGRLDQFFLAELFEEQVDDIAFFVALFVCDMMFFCQFFCSFIICNLVEIDTCIFFDGIVHGQTFKRFSEIDLDTVVRNLCRTADFFCQITEHGFGQFHHTFIISISLIQLHQGEFRVMTGVHTFITEYSSNLEDSLQTTNDQSLQVQFQRNTQFYIFVQCIVMCLERSCRSTTCICNQHRSLYFHEVTSGKEVTDLFEDLRTFDKDFLAFLVHDQIYISLTITGIRIGQTMEFFRKNL